MSRRFGLILGTLLATALQVQDAGAAGAPAVPGRLVDAARLESGAPAIAAALITSDSIQVRVSGVRRLGNPDPVRPGDAFHLGSDAKAMLATLIAQEVERGRLRWDTRIGDLLPEVMVTARPEYRDVTLVQLLTHSAGMIQLLELSDLQQVPPLSGSLPAQRRQFAAWALQQPPVAVPGSATFYSNAGFIVAAAILEAATGQRYERLLTHRLLEPLGITAEFGWPARTMPDAPWGHADAGGFLVPVSPRAADARIPAYADPAGNISMSTREFARFVQLHLRGLRGEARILQPGTFLELHTPSGALAMGWAVADLGGRPISYHEGGSGLFYALMIIDPVGDTAAVVVANADTPAVRVAAAALAARLLAREAAP